MVRELQVNVAKNIPTTFVAKNQMTTGMGAQIDLAAGQAIFPAAAGADNIYMVEREREVSGLKASLTDIDDYDTDFVTVPALLTSMMRLLMMRVTSARPLLLVLMASGRWLLLALAALLMVVFIRMAFMLWLSLWLMTLLLLIPQVNFLQNKVRHN